MQVRAMQIELFIIIIIIIIIISRILQKRVAAKPGNQLKMVTYQLQVGREFIYQQSSQLSIPRSSRPENNSNNGLTP